jgi:hypothetical protein
VFLGIKGLFCRQLPEKSQRNDTYRPVFSCAARLPVYKHEKFASPAPRRRAADFTAPAAIQR